MAKYRIAWLIHEKLDLDQCHAAEAAAHAQFPDAAWIGFDQECQRLGYSHDDRGRCRCGTEDGVHDIACGYGKRINNRPQGDNR